VNAENFGCGKIQFLTHKYALGWYSVVAGPPCGNAAGWAFLIESYFIALRPNRIGSFQHQPTKGENEMGFTIKQVKSKAGDCKSTHRWARVRCESTGNLFTYRIVGIGTKFVRLMYPGLGTIYREEPKNFTRVW